MILHQGYYLRSRNNCMIRCDAAPYFAVLEGMKNQPHLYEGVTAIVVDFLDESAEPGKSIVLEHNAFDLSIFR